MLVLLVLAIPVQADLIQKTITIDGNFGDWAEILANPDQTSDDEEGDTIADGDFPVQSTGRDLNTFAYTWDDDNLYFYVSRYGSSNNTNWWWFYLDLNANGLMETGEKVYSVEWSGSTGKTEANLYDYTASAAGGDPLTSGGTADGYTLPGTISNKTNVYGAPPSSVTGGSADGIEMEAYLPWSVIFPSSSVPTPLGFHIASSNSTNLPGQIDDNMDDVNENFMFFGDTDLVVTKTAVAMDGTTVITDAVGGNQFQYIITVENTGAFGTFNRDASGVTIDDILPAGLTFVSATSTVASATTTVDQGSYSANTWTIGDLAFESTATLTITVTVDNPPNTTTQADPLVVTNTANNLQLLEVDFDADNNEASVLVTLHPGPVLSLSKTSVVLDDGLTGDDEFHVPGAVVEYTVVLENTSSFIAADSVVISDVLPAETTYEPGTLTVTTDDGTTVNPTDNSGDDAGEVVSGSVTVDLGTVAISSTTTVKFQVKIN